jgi:hypothetical protein
MTLQQLEATVNEQLAEVRNTLRKRSITWLVLAGVGLVLLIVLWFTVLKPKPTTDPRVPELQREIDGLKQNNLVLDSLVKVKAEELKTNKTTETKLKTKYDKIPDAVNDLSRDELRKQLSKYDY